MCFIYIFSVSKNNLIPFKLRNAKRLIPDSTIAKLKFPIFEGCSYCWLIFCEKDVALFWLNRKILYIIYKAGIL